MTKIGLFRIDDPPQFRAKITTVTPKAQGYEVIFFRPKDTNFKCALAYLRPDFIELRSIHFL
ncbi:hypothetical protein J6TS1_29870 [Siminovitchia terrae]|uniref:Uncharacterized protein n=1 Tax=Siminovitchia terrae TaxID=1914933 RepID=A0ABQ4L0M5_SIMTE|nr:hypothetical protein J6TS1_29870 [Siminovitchia terrae]